MFPVPDSISSSFLLAASLAMLASIALHELGHVGAGAIAGLRVLACGIGYRRPFARCRIGGTCFYIGYPFTLGLTIVTWGRFSPPRPSVAASLLGGPAANMIGAAAAFALWHAGLRWDFIT